MDKDITQIEDVPKGGPLEHARLRASFDWKKLKLFIEDLDLHEYKVSKFSRNRFLS